MSERSGKRSSGTGTAEIPVVRPATSAEGQPAPSGAVETGTAQPTVAAVSEPDVAAPGPHATASVSVRPAPRAPRRGPLTVMGPWAPVAGGLLGLLLGVLTVLLLAGAAETFAERLALAFTVLGLGMLGTSGTLLADEVRMIRQGARDAAVRPALAEATGGLLHGITPARLLLVCSVVVLFLAAYVTRG